MAIGNFPGVYPDIIDLSQVIAANSTTSCAYVGESDFGPVFTPTLVSNLKTYVDKFGQLNSKFGYMGYSLAVAADSINNHYVVRVVDKDSARYAAKMIAKNGAVAGSIQNAYDYDTIEAAKQDSSSLFIDSATSTIDANDAFVVVAENPNNRSFKVAIEDSTINVNRNFTATTATVAPKAEVAATYVLTITAPELYNADQDDIQADDYLEITNASIDAVNTLVKVVNVTKNEANAYIITCEFESVDEITAGNITGLKFLKQPEDNEKTFSVKVYETVGKATTLLETFKYCTLYPSKDNYGNSMFVEDVINGVSEYICVYVNSYITEDNIILPAYSPVDDNGNVILESLTGGTSGISLSQSQNRMKYLQDGWELFRDRSQTNVTLLMNSGYGSKSDAAYQNKMLEIAEARRDCFCLFDTPMTETSAEKAKSWRKDIFGSNSYRGAVSSPWVKTYDSVAGKSNFIMCPSAYVAKIIGGSDPWIAPAGLNRGILSSATVSPTGLTEYYDNTIGGDLYENQINCIIKNPGAGYVNWGQKTLQQKPSALDRINVARTVIFIETTLRDAAKYHLFENNTAFNRMQITLQFNQFLDTILSADGLSGYQVICDESNNTAYIIQNNQLVIDVYLWPVYTAEFIKLNTIVMGADASVTVSTGS